MKIFIVRHGQDDDSVRGGWSNAPLTETGVQQSIDLAEIIYNNAAQYNIGKIFSSDIIRASRTANIMAEKLNLPVYSMPEFREVNNGDLAGLKNILAEEQYPNLYWRNLEWEEHYPNGESPKEFYDRVSNAWEKLKKSSVSYDKNILLVTHGGVINIIGCIVEGKTYSNKETYQGIPSAKIALRIEV